MLLRIVGISLFFFFPGGIFLDRDSRWCWRTYFHAIVLCVVVKNESPGLGRTIDFLLNPFHFLPSITAGWKAIVPASQAVMLCCRGPKRGIVRGPSWTNANHSSDLLAKETVGWKNNARRGGISMEITTLKNRKKKRENWKFNRNAPPIEKPMVETVTLHREQHRGGFVPF